MITMQDQNAESMGSTSAEAAASQPATGIRIGQFVVRTFQRFGVIVFTAFMASALLLLWQLIASLEHASDGPAAIARIAAPASASVPVIKTLPTPPASAASPSPIPSIAPPPPRSATQGSTVREPRTGRPKPRFGLDF